MSKNLETWNRFYNTPPEVTEEFTLSKKPNAKVFNSIKPYYRTRCVTELFGTVGVGWKTKIYDRWCETLNGRTCVFVTLVIEYKDPETGEWCVTCPHTGGTEIADWVRPDEAYKSAETDAFGKCCADFGIGADIYDSVFDGDKYQAEKRSREQGDGNGYQSRPTSAPHEVSANDFSDDKPTPRGGWQNVTIPFGKNKDKPLSSLSTKSLQWYVENYKVNPKFQDSVVFGNALQEAARELNIE